MNEDTWGDLDTWERRDHELIRRYLNDASEEFENESWKLRMNNSEMMGYGESIWKDSWIAPDGWKEFKRAMNLREKGQDLEETLLRSSNVENDDKNHHWEYFLGTPEWKLEKRVARAQFTGKNLKMNEDTWRDLDTW